MDQPSGVDFHFDIMCPYAYQTSLWIRQVRTRPDVDLRWRFFSLEEINRAEGKKHPWEREWSYGWSMMRVGALLRRQAWRSSTTGTPTAGKALHEEGRKPHRPEVAEELLVEMGLDPDLVPGPSPTPPRATRCRPSTTAVVSKGASASRRSSSTTGRPVRSRPGQPARRRRRAVRLWEHVTGWLEFPHVYELQRPKRAEDIDAIATAFAPYLEARDWFSVQNPTP